MTLEKVAALAGVSRSTASRVVRNRGSVSNRARERVERVLRETGFQPNAAARSLAGHRTNIIGLYISEISRFIFNDPYFGRLIEGVTQAANEHDQTLTLFLQHDANDASRMTKRMLQNQFMDGLVISNTVGDNAMIPQLLERELPFIVVGRHEDPNVSYVDTDNIGGAQTAVNHLLRQGYRRVGIITGTMSNYSSVDRLQGYRDAHHARNREVDQNLIYEGEYLEESGFDGTHYLLEQGVDAIFAGSDAIAVGALRAIYGAGLSVPNDIALIGFDDLPFAATTNPPLTTVRQTIRRTGNLAVATLLDVVANKSMKPQRISLPTELVIRESCGGAR